MQVGHTIVQEVKFPPIKSLSIKVLFAVRISDVIDEKERKGFTYETLEGHVEQGISTFLIEKLKSGKTVFSIETFSKPANFLSVLLAPVVSVPYQKYCTNAALENVKKCFKNET